MHVEVRLSVAIALWSAAISAQALPTGFARGVVVENLSSGSAGEFCIQSAPDQIYRFRTDRKTWIERENERIPASGLREGEVLEVVSDRDSDKMRIWHYARMVQVITARRELRKTRAILYGILSHDSDRMQSLSNLNYAGVVKEVSREGVVLRTRFDGERTIHLRQDTQLLEGGNQVAPSVLLPPLRVFVRAGKDRNNELEAFQIIWGSILKPADFPGRE